MKKTLHMLLALCLAFLMVFGDAAAVLAEPGSAAAAVEESQVLARSRKKKNNATATPAAKPERTETPAPGQGTDPAAKPTPNLRRSRTICSPTENFRRILSPRRKRRPWDGTAGSTTSAM